MEAEQVPNIRPRIKETVFRLTGIIGTWAIMSGCVMILAMFLAIDMVSLGPKFIFIVLATGILTVMLVSIAMYLLSRHRSKASAQPANRNLSTRQLAVLLAATALIIVSGFTVSNVRKEIQENQNAEKALVANDTFVLVYAIDSGREFDEKAVNQTLAELLDSYQELESVWGMYVWDRQIEVVLYQDLSSYRELTGATESSAHVRCRDRGTIIEIPLEAAPSVSNEDYSTHAPVHEMVHALMCKSLGWEKFHSIPRWFHEGIASRYQVEGVREALDRVPNRVAVWWLRKDLLEPNLFCATRFNTDDRRNTELLYLTSLEFIKSLEAKHGIDTLNSVVNDVGNGERFDDSMARRLGGTCPELYGNWKNSF